jgi:hypothetical protein
MEPTQIDQTIKILRDEEAYKLDRRITSADVSRLPPGCAVLPMTVLDRPEPIRKDRLAR